MILEKLSLPFTVSTLLGAIVLTIIGAAFFWLVGLLVAVIFFAISIGLLYAFNKLEILDVKDDRWLLMAPFIMFFVGLGLDKLGVLSIQPMSLTDSASVTPITWIFLAIIIVLLIVDILVSRE